MCLPEHVDAGIFTSSIYQLKRRRIDARSTSPGPNTADSWHTSDGLAVLDMKTFAASSPSRNLQYHQYACANSVLNYSIGKVKIMGHDWS